MKTRFDIGRITAFLLVICMILPLLPVTVFGEGSACEIEGTSYETLDSALTAVAANQTIRLLKNITHKSEITVKIDTPFTIDVNGFKLELEPESSLDHGIYSSYYASLSIVDNDESKTGSLEVNISDEKCSAIYASGEGSNINIEVPTTINVTADNSEGIYAFGGAEVYLNGNIIIAGDNRSYGAYAQGSTKGAQITIDGTITTTGGANKIGIYQEGFNELIVSNETLGYLTYQLAGDTAVPPSTIRLKTSEVTTTPLEAPTNLAWDTSTEGVIKVKWDAVDNAQEYEVFLYKLPTLGARGRTKTNITETDITVPLSALGAGSYYFKVIAYPADDSPYTVSEFSEESVHYVNNLPECRIGETDYATLEDALANVQNNETITLLQSINHSKPIVINDKTITFGMGSFNLNIDTSATDGSTALKVNIGKIFCTGSGRLNVKGSKYGVNAVGGSEIHVSGDVIAGQYGVTTSGSDNPKVTIDGDVTVNGQGVEAKGDIEAIGAGGYATVTIGGNVIAKRKMDAQKVTAIYSNGSTITVGKNVSTQGSGVNVQNDGKVTIDGILNSNPTGSQIERFYIKLGYPVVIKTADDFEDFSTKPDYKEYKNGNNIVWIKGTEQLTTPTNLAWDTTSGELKATWTSVPNTIQYKVEWYKDGLKLGMETHVNPPNTSTDDMKDNLLVWGPGNYTFTVQATAASGYLDSDVSAHSPSYPHGQTTYAVTINDSYASLTGAGSYEEGDIVTIQAGGRSNYRFTGWTSDDVAIDNENNKTASFTMPDKDITITANWSYTGSSYVSSPYYYYTIKASADIGGTITPSGSLSLREGLDKTFTITPDEDYEIFDVLVDDKSVGAIESYTFTALSQGHTITAKFVEADKPNPFTDVSEDDWFFHGVMWAYENGLMKGTSSTTFSPHVTNTRGMIVTILHRMENTPDPSTSNPFDDVAEESWYYDAILWAAENKIIKGYGNGKFGPDDTITREQMVLILMNYAKFKGYDISAVADLSKLADADSISPWAKDAIVWAYATELIQGYDNKLMTTAYAERCQVAEILLRFFEKIAK